MSNLVTKDHAATLLKITTRELSVYLKRGKLDIEDGKDYADRDCMIDLDGERTKAFMQKKMAKKGVGKLPISAKRPNIEMPPADYDPEGTYDSDSDEVGEDGVLPLHISEKKLKHFMAIRGSAKPS